MRSLSTRHAGYTLSYVLPPWRGPWLRMVDPARAQRIEGVGWSLIRHFVSSPSYSADSRRLPPVPILESRHLG